MTDDSEAADRVDEDFVRFETADSADKRGCLEKLIAKSPDGRFRIPSQLGRRAHFVKAILPGVWLAGAHIRRGDFREANLRKSMLGGADLSEALFELADLEQADLVGAKLPRASMGECILRGALLEDCILTNASLRFANLHSATLERADLCGADLWGARLDSAQASGAVFRNATFGESSAIGGDFSETDFSGASISRVDFDGSSFEGAHFENARLTRVGMRNVSFQEAQLFNVDLSTCSLEGARFAGAWLERTRVRRGQLGSAIGEDAAKEWRGAASGYFSLERNFISLGDQDAARWAYGKRRRMEKKASYTDAARAVRQGRILEACRSGSVGAAAELAQSVCDYGESVSRVSITIVIVFLTFAVLYGITGSVVQVEGAGGKPVTTHNAADLLTFSALAMTTLGTPYGLAPANVGVELMRGLEAFSAIFLTGLLGFVAGNRIRR